MNALQRFKIAVQILAGYHMQRWTPERNFYVDPSQSARVDIPYGVRKRMLDWSREMERKDPLFNRFLDLCEQYVIGPNGLQITSASKDSTWAERANAEWVSWLPWCDISSRFSFGQRQSLIEREVEVAGEVFLYLTFGSTNKPRIQIIESECIETPPERNDDKSIIDGVHVDGHLRPLGYWYKTTTPEGKADYTEILAEQMVHIFEPSRVGQTRGLPIVYPVLKDMIDLYELQNFEMQAAKDASETSKVITTSTGEVQGIPMRRLRYAGTTQNQAGTNTATTVDNYYELAFGAKTRVLKKGDTMAQFQSDRPSVAVQAFWDYVAARTSAGLGLPIEVVIMRSIQGTMARGAFDMAASFFRCRAASRAESFARVWEHVVGNNPRLRVGQPQDWRSTSYVPPRAINVDTGRNSSAMINELKVGATHLELIYSPLGLDWKTQVTKWLDQREYIFNEESRRGIPHAAITDAAQTQSAENVPIESL